MVTAMATMAMAIARALGMGMMAMAMMTLTSDQKISSDGRGTSGRTTARIGGQGRTYASRVPSLSNFLTQALSKTASPRWMNG